MKKQTVRYEIAGKAYEGIAVWDDSVSGKRPAVLIAPTFMGVSALEEEKAEKLAKLGYAAFIADIFGVEVRPQNVDEAVQAMQVLNGDRAALATMMKGALSQMLALDVVNAGKVAAIGYCLGGKCVLDLARQGGEVAGIAMFHGLFDPPNIATADTITAKVLALHGWDDPLAKPDDVIAFAIEMTEKKADWQLQAYGHAQHGFTTSNRPDMYNETADRRSWRAMENFLSELFA